MNTKARIQISTICLAAAAFAAWGCTGGSSASASGTTTGGGEAKPPTLEVKATLKTAAYDWMGFGRLEPYNYLITDMEGAEPQAGTQTLSLVDASDAAAKYQITRGGAMERLGSEEFELRPDGIYQTNMAIGKLEKPMLAMPADIAPGKTWPSKFTAKDAGGQTIVFDVVNKAERIEKVKVKAGEYDALLVTTTGKMTATTPADATKPNSKPKTVANQVSSKGWYAKGVGNIKMTLEVKKPDGTNIKNLVELASIGEQKADETTAKPDEKKAGS